MRDEHGDREHEVEEKAKEESTSSPAAPTVPSSSGEATTNSSTPNSKEVQKRSSQADAQKKLRIAADDASKIQKRPRDQETDESEKTARRDGMTDVNTATASSSSTSIAPSIPVGPNMQGSIKRELDDARDDDEAPEKAQKIMSICVGQGAADKMGKLNAQTYKEDLGGDGQRVQRQRSSRGVLCTHQKSKFEQP